MSSPYPPSCPSCLRSTTRPHSLASLFDKRSIKPLRPQQGVLTASSCLGEGAQIRVAHLYYKSTVSMVTMSHHNKSWALCGQATHPGSNINALGREELGTCFMHAGNRACCPAGEPRVALKGDSVYSYSLHLFFPITYGETDNQGGEVACDRDTATDQARNLLPLRQVL